MAKVKIEFTVVWNGNKEATLFFLLDGGVVVSLAGMHTTGTGKIVVSYLADNTGVHVIEWGLTFPGTKIGGFAATARIADGPVQDLAAEDAEQEHKWTGAGQAVG